MNFNFDRKNLTKQAMVAAIYAVITWALQAVAYGPLQFRVSEVMTLLAFYNPQYILGLTVGCAIANIFSSFGFIDVVVGTFASFVALVAMSKIKNIWIASLMPALSAVIIAAEIVFVSPEPISFYLITAQIAASQFIVVTILGVPLFKYVLEKNEFFKKEVLSRD